MASDSERGSARRSNGNGFHESEVPRAWLTKKNAKIVLRWSKTPNTIMLTATIDDAIAGTASSLPQRQLIPLTACDRHLF